MRHGYRWVHTKGSATILTTYIIQRLWWWWWPIFMRRLWCQETVGRKNSKAVRCGGLWGRLMFTCRLEGCFNDDHDDDDDCNSYYISPWCFARCPKNLTDFPKSKNILLFLTHFFFIYSLNIFFSFILLIIILNIYFSLNIMETLSPWLVCKRRYYIMDVNFVKSLKSTHFLSSKARNFFYLYIN